MRRLFKLRYRRSSLFVFAFVVLLLGCEKTLSVPYVALHDQTDHLFLGPGFKSAAYLHAAAKLQAMGREAALVKLRQMADDSQCEYSVIALCRMLFKSRSGESFRRPMLGAPGFIGKSDSSAWTLEPIEIVDGVPIVVVCGYMLAGEAELPKSYLEYCETECDWSDVKYTIPNGKHMRLTLNKLITSPKWNEALDTNAILFLEKQLQ